MLSLNSERMYACILDRYLKKEIVIYEISLNILRGYLFKHIEKEKQMQSHRNYASQSIHSSFCMIIILEFLTIEALL